MFAARRAQARITRRLVRRDPAPSRGRPRPGARNILMITADQQRFDALGVNGGRVARTPALDAIAAAGINYQRAHVQNVVCMPSRSTMLTGQHPYTHGVIANGVPLPGDAPSVVAELRERAGYRTALIGKAHFDPHFDLTGRFFENRVCAEGLDGRVWHGFEHLELATHSPIGGHHWAVWLRRDHPEALAGFGGVLTGAAGGDTGASEVAHNPVARELYHTDWIAERTIRWIDSQPAGAPWFCWMSFPDPHHPFDPPLDELRARVDWRDLDLPARYPASRADAEAVLAGKPRHWLDWYRGRFRNPEGGSVNFVPSQMTADQVREANAAIHVENELIDEACGRVFAHLTALGLDGDTDIIYTSDHGELQGDYGLFFKGPYHVDSLLRVPLIWRPARGRAPAVIDEPVGLVDIAPTLCRIAGLEIPSWMEGEGLPAEPGQGRERVLTTFDSQFASVGMHLQTIYRDGYLCTRYLPRTHQRDPLGRYWKIWGLGSEVPTYDGSEGELYDLGADPDQRTNLWSDPTRRSLRDDLLADLEASLPRRREPPLPVEAPT